MSSSFVVVRQKFEESVRSLLCIRYVANEREQNLQVVAHRQS